jgi:hypothetical protein
METIMNKLILASIFTVTISMSASYADANATGNADKKAGSTETVALRPDPVDTKRANPSTAPAVETPKTKNWKDIPSISDFPISVY